MGMSDHNQREYERRERAISEIESESDDQPEECHGKITFDEDSSTSELLENLQKIKSNEP